MNFFALSSTIENINMVAGDEIAVYDGDICVGTTILNAEILEGEYVTFVASADDGMEDYPNGYTPGNIISYKIWDSINNIEYESNNIEVTYTQGENVFEVGASNIFHLNALTTNLTENISLDFELSSVYPNPFNPLTTIKYQIPSAGPVNISVYNMNGQFVDELHQMNSEAGYHEIIWNANNIASGIYIIKISYGNMIQMQKVMLLK
jgi:hypothetical protein